MTLGRSAIVVAGMHRSGTSLIASILASLGVDMGARKLAADRNNPRGYFEDLDFLALNREMLNAASLNNDGGHPDWGWTESERLDRDRFTEYAARAAKMLDEHPLAHGDAPWGWKDPRSTLLLDFWDSLLGGARYVLVYRFPWEVADSMQRLGAEVFLRRPDYAWRIWAFYNRHLLDFHRRHRDRTLLVNADAARREPGRLLALLQERLGLDASAMRPQEIIDPELFQASEADDPLMPLVTAAHSDCAALLAELDAAADLSSTGLWSAAKPAARAIGSAPPRVSVVIPCYDQGEFLLEAVASVERSIPEPYELIVVNDGSREPRTLEVMKLLREAGYRIVDQENRGLASARNAGIELARSPYILPLDADNRLRPGFTTPALAILDDRPEVAAVYGDRFDFGMRNGKVDVPPCDPDSLLPFNFIDACALLRKDVWLACGGYDGSMPEPGWEDWDLWIGVIERGLQLHHLPVLAFDYRVRPSSMITAFEDEARRERLLAWVIAKHRDLYWKRLPAVLVASQRSAANLFRLAREHERLQAEMAATFQEHQARVGIAAAEQTRLAGESGALRTRHEQLGQDHADLLAERERTKEELIAWQERVAAMEGTRAWRLRQRLIDFKSSLRRRKKSP